MAHEDSSDDINRHNGGNVANVSESSYGSSKRRRVAYLGPAFSFSHQAAEAVEPNGELIPRNSFAAIFEAIQEDSAYDLAVLPVENSTNGNVMQALDLLAKCDLEPSMALYKDIEVIGEYYLDVHHYLYVNKQWLDSCVSKDAESQTDIGTQTAENIMPIVNTADARHLLLHNLKIATVHSHPQVWGQCNIFLSKTLPPGQVERVDMSSTSAAARFVSTSYPGGRTAEADYKPSAAICSKLAGENNRNLALIRENIEDDPGSNTTRFLILRNRSRNNNSLQQNAIPDILSLQHKHMLTLVTAHHQPGSLAQALAVFSQLGFNLCAIQSRPRPCPRDEVKNGKMHNWRYVFFVECLGRPAQNNIEELLSSLAKLCEHVKLLGSWIDSTPK